MSSLSVNSNVRTVIFLGGLSLLSVGCNSEKTPEGGARLKTEGRTYASAPKEGHVKHRFKIMSVGDQPLEITRVDSSCGCTVAESSTTSIKPGEAGFVDADLTVAPNRRESTIYVHTNDPAQDIIVFRISALGLRAAQLAFVPAVLKVKGKSGELITGKCMLQLSVWKPASRKIVIDQLNFASSSKAIVVSSPEALSIPERPKQSIGNDQNATTQQVALYSHLDRDVFLIPVEYQIQLAAKPRKQRFYSSAQLGKTPEGPKALLSVVATVNAD